MDKTLNNKELLADLIDNASKLLNAPMNHLAYNKRAALLITYGVNTKSGVDIRSFNTEYEDIVHMIAQIVCEGGQLQTLFLEGVARGLSRILQDMSNSIDSMGKDKRSR